MRRRRTNGTVKQIGKYAGTYGEEEEFEDDIKADLELRQDLAEVKGT